jgi:ketosteroid isomerase-like protein
MSQKNVDVIRDWVEKTIVGGEDIRDLGDLSFLHPGVLYEDEILPDHVGETYRGHEGFRRAWMRAIEPWESIEARLEWVKDAGDNVVSCHWGRMQGKGSGIEAEIRYAYVWTFEDGKVIRCKSFVDPDAALEAAELRE